MDALYIVGAMLIASAIWPAMWAALHTFRRLSAARKRRALFAWQASRKNIFPIMLCGFIFLGVFCSTVRGAADFDPVIGVWRLNVEKSQSPGSILLSATRKYERDSAGIRITETRVTVGGHRSQIEYIGNYDGKEHPVFLTNDGEKEHHRTDETMSFTRLDRYTVKGVSRAKGKIAYTFTRTVSPDGRTLTIATAGPGPHSSITVLVYEKEAAEFS
jgi:hypothetical protein